MATPATGGGLGSGEETFHSSHTRVVPTVILIVPEGVRMSQNDKDMLLEVVRVLDVIIGRIPAEMRHAFRPLIDSVEFITRMLERGEQGFSRPRVVGSRWLVLGEFFESVCGVNRAEFFAQTAGRSIAACRTSRAPQSFTIRAHSPASPAPSCSARGSASTGRTGSRTRFPATTWPTSRRG